MKRLLIYCFFILFIISCDSEDAGDCFKTAGVIEQYDITVSTFSKIVINERVELILKEGPVEKVVLETGKNLMNNIIIEVINGQLTATNNNKCNFVRKYGITKIYVTAPNITEIRNASDQKVSSDGILTYPNLSLISEDHNVDALNIGDFNLEVNNTNTTITSNGISNFYLKGNTINLRVSFFAGDSRFEGKDLIANNIFVLNRVSNDILVNPQDKIEGDIYSLGDVIAFNEPVVVNVTEHYKGRLIFK